MPIFEQVRGGVLVKIKREAFVAMQNSDCVESGVESGVENYAHKVIKGTSANDVQLTDRQQRIIELITLNPSISIVKMAQTLAIAVRTVQRELAALQKQGILNREGTKGGRWIIVAK